MTHVKTAARPDLYPLGRTDAETRRLILQHQIYGPLTRQFLRAAGITSGMKVLDLGSGAGDVALLLADIVGPQGRVVGVDMNPDILSFATSRSEAAGWSTVTFHQANLAHVDFARDLDLDFDFDAIVGRWVIMYVPDPANLLGRVSALLRPGGIVAIQESDLTTPVRTYPSTPLHDRLAHLMHVDESRTDESGSDESGSDESGPDGAMGLKLFRTFVDAGLPAPQLCLHTPAGGGPSWPGYAYLTASVRSLLPHLEQVRGVQPEDLDLDTLEERLRDEIVSIHGMQILTSVIGAWTRT